MTPRLFPLSPGNEPIAFRPDLRPEPLHIRHDPHVYAASYDLHGVNRDRPTDAGNGAGTGIASLYGSGVSVLVLLTK